MKKFLFAFVVLISGCDYYDNSLKMVNESKVAIAVEESNYRDSVQFNNIAYYLSNIIQPDSTSSLTIPGKQGAWRRRINAGSEKKLFIYVFASDTLKKYEGTKTMYDLYSLKKYIKKYEFTEKQLDSIGWKVMYNPALK